MLKRPAASQIVAKRPAERVSSKRPASSMSEMAAAPRKSPAIARLAGQHAVEVASPSKPVSLDQAPAITKVPVVEHQHVSTLEVEESLFGDSCDNLQATLYTLRSPAGVTVAVTDYGAAITHLLLPDKHGVIADCVLGFDDLAGYRKRDNLYFGAIVGRCANRIANGKFSIDGEEYSLERNHGPNHLHGGHCGFDKVLWSGTLLQGDPQRVGVRFTYVSADGEEGYPGKCSTSVTYTLHLDGSVKIDMQSAVMKPCPVNLANHSYFNLAGHGSGDILDHKLQIMASRYTPTDASGIPTGEILPVVGTAFDFRQDVRHVDAPTIGSRIEELRDLTGSGGGYDHNFVLDIKEGDSKGMRHAATVLEPVSGRRIEVFCTTPGVQFHTGNYLGASERGGGIDNKPVVGKSGVQYSLHHGFCLETQHFPDSINKEESGFLSCLLRPGGMYEHRVLFKFAAE